MVYLVVILMRNKVMVQIKPSVLFPEYYSEKHLLLIRIIMWFL